MTLATGDGRCCKVCCKMLKGSCGNIQSSTALLPALLENRAEKRMILLLPTNAPRHQRSTALHETATQMLVFARHSGRAADDRHTASNMPTPAHLSNCTCLTPSKLASARPYCVIEYAEGCSRKENVTKRVCAKMVSVPLTLYNTHYLHTLTLRRNARQVVDGAP